jgi:DNA topoisomerase-1
MLAADSPLKQRADLEKYEKARKLKILAPKIREDYTMQLKSKQMIDRQKATALYFIDKLALRAGNEKDTEDEADTVGCCSLRCEHVKFIEPDQVEFDFLGKDSIRFHQVVELEIAAWKAMKELWTGKGPKEMIFDKIDPGTLNDYFREFMTDLSVKVFRTYNASVTLAIELGKYDSATFHEPANHHAIYQFYEAANRQVAILCNHQKGVSKNHGEQVEKMQGQLATMEAQMEDLQKQLKFFKKKSKGDVPKKGKVMEKLPQNQTVCENAIEKKEKQIYEFKRKITMKEENKTTSLGTSKMNYMDPRITVAFCKRAELPIEKCFPQTLRAKFPWAMHAESSFDW